MTSAQFLRPVFHGCAVGLIALPIVLGCSRTRLTAPEGLQAPYGREQLWAVAPPTNESGVSMVDTARLADVLAQEAEQVAGVNVVPVNRVLLAMRQAGLDAVTTAGDARALMGLLEVDGLLMGTVTAYDPYRPPRLGLAVQLFVATPRDPEGPLDSRTLTLNAVGEVAPAGLDETRAVAQASGVYDAANHGTLLALRNYAAGRTEPDSAFGEDIYLVRMELFAQFVSHQLIRDLLRDEQARLTLETSPEAVR